MLLAGAMLLPANAFAASPEDFTDFPTDWSAAGLRSAVQNGLLNGSNGRINSSGLLIRAQMAAIVNRAFEKVIVKEFDLALRKWVTQAIVIDSNGQTVTETGHDAWDDPEQVVKVELHRKKLNEVTVKFRYSIRVYNQGDIAGYAKEVTDYVPEGLKFVSEDNQGWTDEGNNVISTRLLENTLLQPGEYADVEVVLTWINNQDNMGVMINTAEISEDYNDYGVPDRDSTPDNKKPDRKSVV